MTGNYNQKLGIGVLSGIFALASLIPAVIVYIKRFHDRDKSGWWVLIGFIPIIGAIWLLIEVGFSPRHTGAEPVWSTGDGLAATRDWTLTLSRGARGVLWGPCPNSDI